LHSFQGRIDEDNLPSRFGDHSVEAENPVVTHESITQQLLSVLPDLSESVAIIERNVARDDLFDCLGQVENLAPVTGRSFA
jgi:hypothetical protein